MKKIIPLLIGVVLICGCNKLDNNSAKIDALNDKIDVLTKNQAVAWTNNAILFSRLEALQNQLTNLPTIEQVNNLDYYYFTNSFGRLNEMDARLVLMSETSRLESKLNSIAFSNNLIVLAGTGNILNQLQDLQSEQSSTLGEIAGRTVGIESLLTNGTTEDITYTRLKVEDMGHDLDQIKIRLGIAY